MNSIWEQAEALSPQIIAQRRDLHKFRKQVGRSSVQLVLLLKNYVSLVI